MEKPIGILGSNFDPIHLGHLHLALQTQQQLNLEKVKLIPCYQSPLRSLPCAGALDRAKMIQLAITKYPTLELDERESQQARKSYTIDTLRTLRQELPFTPLVLIMGADAFAGLNNWQEWEKLLEYTHIIVVKRPRAILSDTQHLLSTYQTADNNNIHQQLAGTIIVLDINAPDISSSMIRTLLQQKKNVDLLLPGEVKDYINQHQLY